MPSSSIAYLAAALRPFVCSSTGGGVDAAWVHVAGELDMATSPQLEQALSESHARLVVLDLRAVEFMDCAGVHVIVSASSDARRDGRRLILLRGSRTVDRVFALTSTYGDVEIGDLDLLEPVQPRRLFADEALVP